MSCKSTSDVGKRIQVLPNSVFPHASKPKILAQDLDNPMSPRLFRDRLVFSQSGKGQISMVSLQGGQVTPLITRFGMDAFGGYNISVQGILIDPRTSRWIVCAAEGPGRVFIFDPATFPTEAKSGREVPILGATDDNPFAAVLSADDRFLIISSGTSKAYRAIIKNGDPSPLEPFLEVETGIIGLTVDPVSGDVFGAVFGSSNGEGSVIRWPPAGDAESVKTVASGFNNLVDVAFTPEGRLLALEFGEFGEAGEGAISIVATDGSGKITPLIKGIDNPSGIFVSPNHNLFITEFGVPINGQNGTIISVDFGKRPMLFVWVLVIVVLLILFVLLALGITRSRRREEK